MGVTEAHLVKVAPRHASDHVFHVGADRADAGKLFSVDAERFEGVYGDGDRGGGSTTRFQGLARERTSLIFVLIARLCLSKIMDAVAKSSTVAK